MWALGIVQNSSSLSLINFHVDLFNLSQVFLLISSLSFCFLEHFCSIKLGNVHINAEKFDNLAIEYFFLK